MVADEAPMSSFPGPPAGPSAVPATSVPPPGWGGAAGLRPEAPLQQLTGPAAAPVFAPPAGSALGAPPAATRSGPWWRVLAYLIDYWAAGVAALVAAVVAAHLALDPAAVLGLTLLGGLAGWTAATVGAASRFPGQTLGKRCLGLYVIRPGEGPIGTRTTAVRELGARLIYFIPLVVLADLWMADRPSRQSIRDRMVDTYVVGRPEAQQRTRGWLVALGLAAVLFGGWIGLHPLRSSALSSQRSAFVRGCSGRGQPEAVCGCLWAEITARYSGAELDRILTADGPGRLTPAEIDGIRQAGVKCTAAGRVGGGAGASA